MLNRIKVALATLAILAFLAVEAVNSREQLGAICDTDTDCIAFCDMDDLECDGGPR